MSWRLVAVPVFYALLLTGFFAPVLLSGRLLAPGDATLLYLPAFRSTHALWEPLIGSGFPLAADGSSQPFYPVAALARMLGSWNLLVAAAYVIAASGMFALVFELTGYFLGSLFAGIVVALSGFLIAHLPHLTQIHAAAWTPVLLWACARLRRRTSRRTIAVAGLAVALSGLAAHPQHFVYGVSLAAGFALAMGWDAPVGRRRFWTSIGIALCLGCGIAAVQWMPMFELGGQSHRAKLTFEEFVSFSLPARQAAQIFFPYLFGGALPSGPFAPAYYGRWNLGETTAYLGFLPWMAAAVGVRRHPERRLVAFWTCVAVVGLLLALGGDTPLAKILYRVPAFGDFRCPARHLMATTFAIAILAGLGLDALRRSPYRAGRTALGVVAAACALFVPAVLGFAQTGVGDAAARLSASLERPAVVVPLAFAALAASAFASFAARPTSAPRGVVLLCVAALDLATFGWFAGWRHGAPDAAELTPPAWLAPYAERLRAERQRLATFHPSTTEAALPNIAWLWGAPNASVYPQLALGRQRQLLPIENGLKSFCPEDRALDLLAVRYAPRPRSSRDGFEWEFVADPGCDGAARTREHVWIVPDLPASRVGLVAAMGNSVMLPDGALVATLEVETSHGTIERAIRAGEHVSELAYDRADVRARVRHRRARIFDSVAVLDDANQPFELHRYLADIDLGGKHVIRRVTVRPERRIALHVDLASIADERASQPLVAGLLDSARWRLAGASDGVRIYENLRVMPRAWLVREVVALDPAAILATIHTSRLPDGRAFDPRTTALLEEPLSLAGGEDAGAGEVVDVRIEDESVEVLTRAPGERLLVTSDAFHPGWHAAVDGEPVRVHAVDHALRGVVVPAGEHRVRFEFRPASFRAGAAISLVSLAMLGGLVATWRSGTLGKGERR